MIRSSLLQIGRCLLLSTFAGMTFGQVDFGPPENSSFSLGPSLYGVHAADLDLDGDNDLVIQGSVSMALRRNNGAGFFSNYGATLDSGVHVAIADLNGDGWPEILRSETLPAAGVRVYWNVEGVFFEGNSTLFPVTGTYSPYVGLDRIAVGDFDQDGDLDLFVADRGATWSGTFLSNDGTGGLYTPTGFTPIGQPFAFATDISQVEVADVDGDGALDLAISTLSDGAATPQQMRVFRNLGSGSWQLIGTYQLGSSAGRYRLADMNGDGAVDWVRMFTATSSMQVRSNDGTGFFQSASSLVVVSGSGAPQELELADLDQDGDQDALLTLRGAGNTLAVLLNDGSGNLRIHATWKTGVQILGDMAVAELDGNGSLDVALAGDGVAILRQDDPFPAEFRKLMITEVSTDNQAYVEVTNFATTSTFVANLVVRWRDTQGFSFTSIPTSLLLGAGQSVLLVESGSSIPAPAGVSKRSVLNPVAATNSDIAVAIADANLTTIDELHLADASGVYGEGSFGQVFRGRVSNATRYVERIWGHDTDAGRDFTIQSFGSPGLENRSSGSRGTDSAAPPLVLINELDDTPDLIELHNASGQQVDLCGWFLLVDDRQGGTHTIIAPFPNPTFWGAGGYLVFGEGAPPPEWPGFGYIDVTALGFNIPWTPGEFDCALYDKRGRLVDLVRTTQAGSTVVHNHPRAPSHWSDFVGGARRFADSGSGAVGRISATDSNSGSDWAPVFTRTMGTPNTSFIGSAWTETAMDVRVTPRSFIVNSSFTQPYAVSFLLSFGHLDGTGPILGLGGDAITNWLSVGQIPGAVLDAQGSFRLDFNFGSPVGIDADLIFLLQDSGAGGAVVTLSHILEWDP